MHYNFSPLANLKYDLPASVVVFLIALPLCLGIAMASGAPLFSGIIAGVVGGLIVGTLSQSPLSVSGPAAGLTVIVLEAIHSLPTFEAFLLAVCLAGLIQMVFSVIRAGVIGDFIPSSVIVGMLAAIGLILIMKQVPYAVGYEADFEGNESFAQAEGGNTFSSLIELTHHFTPGAVVISIVSLAFLFWWDKKQPKLKSVLRYLPGPLAVVMFGIVANEVFQASMPTLALAGKHMVAVPVSDSFQTFIHQLRFPSLEYLTLPAVWTSALTLALVASIETLLSIEAIDKLDPFKRVTPPNRELLAQGVGNFISGLIGGLPVTSVIVRSSANVSAGARTQLSAIIHGILLLLCVVAIPTFLNKVPLPALAAVLIAVGYKLVKPTVIIKKYKKGWSHFIPFAVTITAIMLTDLLAGIAIGVIVGILFVLAQNFRSAIVVIADGSHYVVKMKKDLFFIHKYELKRTLNNIPADATLMIDLSSIHFADRDNVEIIHDFLQLAEFKGIQVTIKTNQESSVSTLFKVVAGEAA